MERIGAELRGVARSCAELRGVEWSGVARSGAEWRGVERRGAEWSGVECTDGPEAIVERGALLLGLEHGLYFEHGGTRAMLEGDLAAIRVTRRSSGVRVGVGVSNT